MTGADTAIDALAEIEAAERQPDKCQLLHENRVLKICSALASIIDHHPGSNAKGVYLWDLVSTETFKPTRQLIGIKTAQHRNGAIFCFCPFCGERIVA